MRSDNAFKILRRRKLIKKYNGSSCQSERVYHNGTFMATSDQLLQYRITCKCRKIKIAHGTIQHNRMHANSFNTRLSYNLISRHKEDNSTYKNSTYNLMLEKLSSKVVMLQDMEKVLSRQAKTNSVAF